MGGLEMMSRSMSAPHIKSDIGASAATGGGGFLPLLGATRSASGIIINQATALAEPTIYRCVMIRAGDVARCTPRVMPEGAPRSGQPNSEHAVAKLFKRPNWVQTWFEFALQMETAYILRQNAYAAILRDGRGKPINLIPINPDGVTLLEASNGMLFYQTSRIGLFQMFALKGLPMAIPAEDMLHLRGLSLDMLLGVPMIGLAKDSIGVALGLQQQAARLMANGARPGGALKHKGQITDAAAKRLKQQWEEIRAGLENVGKTILLEEGIEWQALQLSSVDMQFMDQRRMSVDECARWVGVPLWKLSVTAELARIKVDDAQVDYVNTTVKPDLIAWQQKFNQVFRLDDDKLTADLDERDLLHPSEATRVNNQRLKVMSGLSTQNECRAQNGDPPLPGGDVLLTPVNLASSGSDMTGTAPDGAGRPAAGAPPDPGAANAEKSAIAPYVVKDQSVFVQDPHPPAPRADQAES
jgi:HK97 family phage portal protein